MFCIKTVNFKRIINGFNTSRRSNFKITNSNNSFNSFSNFNNVCISSKSIIKNKNLEKPGTFEYSEEKMNYLEYLNDLTIPIVLCTGPTGSGKTYMACKRFFQDMTKNESFLHQIVRHQNGLLCLI